MALELGLIEPIRISAHLATSIGLGELTSLDSG